MDKVEVDRDGNIFLTWRPRVGTEAAVLVKLSQSGEFLWEYVEESVLGGSFHIVQESVKVDSDGNAYLLAATSARQRVVTKLAPDGAVLWRIPLQASIVDYLGVSDSMVVTPDHGVVIVGGHFVNPPFGNFLGFATKLDKDGNTEWWSDGYKGAEAPYAYSTVSIGPKGIICASAPFHTTTFSEKGKTLKTESQIGGIVLDAGQKGFLVHKDANLQFLNANGNLRWSDSFGYDDIIGLVPRQNGGWVVAGGIPGDLEAIVFSRVDEHGKLLWQSALGGYPYAASWWPRRLNNCFLASDGTLRVVVNLPFSEPGGVAVLSIAVEEQLQ